MESPPKIWAERIKIWSLNSKFSAGPAYVRDRTEYGLIIFHTNLLNTCNFRKNDIRKRHSNKKRLDTKKKKKYVQIVQTIKINNTAVRKIPLVREKSKKGGGGRSYILNTLVLVFIVIVLS